MADINKSDNWQNRKSHGGKGDFHANDMRPYRAGSLWGVSDCCGSPVAKLNNYITCEKCLKVCKRVSYKDNPYLDPKHIALLNRAKDPDDRRKWLEGDWSITPGSEVD